MTKLYSFDKFINEVKMNFEKKLDEKKTINVFCDEAHQDLLFARNKRYKYACIGSLWVEETKKAIVAEEFKQLRYKYKLYGEIKWKKVSPNQISFYKELIDLFFKYNNTEELKFRCICINSHIIDNKKYNNCDGELGFYKFYYELLYQWINCYNNYYKIYCDKKNSEDNNRRTTLKEILNNVVGKKVLQVQSLHSVSSPMIQFTDFIIGLTITKMNKAVKENSTKADLIRYFEQKLGKEIKASSKNENKYNVFVIKLQKRDKNESNTF